MARQFAPRHFLRIVSNHLLATYFHQRGLLQEIVFEDRAETDIDAIFDAWQSLPANQRADADADFSEVDSIATDEAMTILAQEAKYLGVAIDDVRVGDEGFHDTAMTVFLNHHELFARVHQLADASERSPRYWYRRNDLPEVIISEDEDTVARLGLSLRYYFKEAEGRGQVCVVEPLRREGSVYFFCYLEDFGRTDIGFGDGDSLQRHHNRPAFEVMFVVTPEQRSLETFFAGSRKTVDHLQKLFFRTLFGFDLPERKDETVYELNGLKDRNFAFVYDPLSGITNVVIKHLRFAGIAGIKRRLTLEGDPSRTRQDVHDFMDDVFDTSGVSASTTAKLPLAAFNIIQARIQVAFEPLPRRRRPTKTFNVSFPNGCSLLHEGQDAAIRQMLRLSGIERQPPASPQKALVGQASGS